MNEKIGTTQAAMLVVNTILPTATVVLPVIIGNYAEQDAPLAVILSTLAGFGVAITVGTLVSYTGGKPFLDWLGEKSSPLVATVLGLLLLQYYLDASSTIFREFINFIKDNVLMNTPIPVLTILILFVAIYMVRQGIEAIARVNSIVILLYIIYIPLYLFGLSGFMDIHRLFPIFDHSLSSLTLASLTPTTWMSEVAVLLFLTPYLKSPQNARFMGMFGLLTVSLLMMFSLITALLVFGPEYINISSYPGFSTAGIVRLGGVIERLDILFISYWVLSIYLKFSIFLFAAVECFKQTFRVKVSRPFIGALGLVVTLECLFVWEDPVTLNNYNQEGRFLVFFLFNLLLPLAIILWYRVKRNHAKRKGWRLE